MAHAISFGDYADPAAARPGLVARLRQAIADRRAYHALRDELAAMSDRDLADIGLSRLNIGDVARAAIRGN